MNRRSFPSIYHRNFSELAFTVIDPNDIAVEVKTKVGETLLDACLDAKLPIEAACGGECCCSTCHIYIPEDLFNKLPEADEDELDMLDLAPEVQDTSRLACQCKLSA